ncbi:putative aldo/keto reductase [Coniella lustricola]|uniref:Putative aldo/keto reductase n=1 Tax=Coniella lustricola TaxID=2025994 RepID=A0A2T2ZU13_9PEZI|nr:putative aldo/keto reductase [Coniella lustricola]
MSKQIIISGKPVGPKIDLPTAASIMKTALEQGATFWNGGMFYGTPEYNSLHVLKYYFTQYPEDADKVTLSIKGAFDPKSYQPTGSPAAIRADVERALQILAGTKKIDVFEMARVDPKVPIEESVQALAELVQEGKIGGVGLSEVSAASIRRAAKVARIEAVEIELSLFTTDPLSNGILAACEDLDIPVVAYSPVGRGFLTGQIRKLEDMAADDGRRHWPRYQADVFDQNFKLVAAVEEIAQRKQVPLASVAIAWSRQQGSKIIALPGASKAKQVVQNCTVVELSDEELREMDRLLKSMPVAGGRYPGMLEDQLNG